MRDPHTHPHDPVEQRVASKQAPLDRFYMPATSPRWLTETVRRSIQRWRIRRSVRALLARDDHILCDLGYSRAQLRRSLKSPQAGGLPAHSCDVREDQ